MQNNCSCHLQCLKMLTNGGYFLELQNKVTKVTINSTSPPIQRVWCISNHSFRVNLRLASIVFQGTVINPASQDLHFLLRLISQMIASKTVAETLSVLGADKPHILTIQFQSLDVFSISVIDSSMVNFELLEGVMNMLVMVVDEFLHGIHGVDVINSRAWPSMTILLQIYVKHIGLIKILDFEISVSDEIMIVM